MDKAVSTGRAMSASCFLAPLGLAVRISVGSGMSPIVVRASPCLPEPCGDTDRGFSPGSRLGPVRPSRLQGSAGPTGFVAERVGALGTTHPLERPMMSAVPTKSPSQKSEASGLRGSRGGSVTVAVWLQRDLGVSGPLAQGAPLSAVVPGGRAGLDSRRRPAVKEGR